MFEVAGGIILAGIGVFAFLVFLGVRSEWAADREAINRSRRRAVVERALRAGQTPPAETWIDRL
jgi:hypothetical protein